MKLSDYMHTVASFGKQKPRNPHSYRAARRNFARADYRWARKRARWGL